MLTRGGLYRDRLAGFSYYGTESMYSGTTGLQLEVDVFIGVVYYQRLRHLVSDKFQVREFQSQKDSIRFDFSSGSYNGSC